MNVETFFGENGPLAKAFDAYEMREQQIEISKAIEEAILTNQPLLGEAPTGVGKSIAALAPAFEAIKNGSVTLVVTSSIVLQEQYFNKDVPLMEKLYGIDTNAVLIKGKNNYLCTKKSLTAQPDGATTEEIQEFNILHHWAKTTKTGDMSELSIEPKRKNWRKFAVSEESECDGKRCSFYNLCHYYRERMKMESAKLIICNYHYLFTAFKTPKLLPAGIKVLILDEGHEAAMIARDMTQIEYGLNSFKTINEGLIAEQQLASATLRRDVAIHEETGLIEMLDTHQAVMLRLAEFYHKLGNKNGGAWTLDSAAQRRLRTIGEEHLAAVQFTYTQFMEYIERKGLNQELRDVWNDYYTEEEIKWQFAIERYTEGLRSRLAIAEYLFGNQLHYYTDPLGTERIIWIEPVNDSQVVIRSKATQAQPTTKVFFDKPVDFVLSEATPIFLSATMTANKQFDYMAKDLGMPSQRIEKMVSTPFDLTENMLWYLPEGMPAGNVPEHRSKVLDEMVRIITSLDGRTLCLFTSTSEMKIAAQHLKGILPAHIQVLLQGELPKAKIVEKMKENPHTVICGTRSFFTGVDVQGPNLSAVLIDKIPFPIAGDPLNDYLINEQNGFNRHTLPETIIAIKQGFGRLNRTATDKGIVAILDGRLSTAQYKKKIFNSFAFKVTATRDFEKVKQYCEVILNGLNRSAEDSE